MIIKESNQLKKQFLNFNKKFKNEYMNNILIGLEMEMQQNNQETNEIFDIFDGDTKKTQEQIMEYFKKDQDLYEYIEGYGVRVSKNYNPNSKNPSFSVEYDSSLDGNQISLSDDSKFQPTYGGGNWLSSNRNHNTNDEQEKNTIESSAFEFKTPYGVTLGEQIKIFRGIVRVSSDGSLKPNESCGLHVNVSIEDLFKDTTGYQSDVPLIDIEKIDFVILFILFNEIKLKINTRGGNKDSIFSFQKDIKDTIKESFTQRLGNLISDISSDDKDKSKKIITRQMKMLNEEVMEQMLYEKYQSMILKDDRIEYRIMGGNYLYDEVYKYIYEVQLITLQQYIKPKDLQRYCYLRQMKMLINDEYSYEKIRQIYFDQFGKDSSMIDEKISYRDNKDFSEIREHLNDFLEVLNNYKNKIKEQDESELYKYNKLGSKIENSMSKLIDILVNNNYFYEMNKITDRRRKLEKDLKNFETFEMFTGISKRGQLQDFETSKLGQRDKLIQLIDEQIRRFKLFYLINYPNSFIKEIKKISDNKEKIRKETELKTYKNILSKIPSDVMKNLETIFSNASDIYHMVNSRKYIDDFDKYFDFFVEIVNYVNKLKENNVYLFKDLATDNPDDFKNEPVLAKSYLLNIIPKINTIKQMKSLVDKNEIKEQQIPRIMGV